MSLLPTAFAHQIFHFAWGNRSCRGFCRNWCIYGGPPESLPTKGVQELSSSSCWFIYSRRSRERPPTVKLTLHTLSFVPSCLVWIFGYTDVYTSVCIHVTVHVGEFYYKLVGWPLQSDSNSWDEIAHHLLGVCFHAFLSCAQFSSSWHAIPWSNYNSMVVTFWPFRLLHRCLNKLFTSCRCLKNICRCLNI